jgi:hypothetical protein
MRALAYVIGFLLLASEGLFLFGFLAVPATVSHRSLIRAESEFQKVPSQENAAEVKRQRQLVRAQTIRGLIQCGSLFAVNTTFLVLTVRWIRKQEAAAVVPK